MPNYKQANRIKTDTGGLDEYSKVIELIVLKELEAN